MRNNPTTDEEEKRGPSRQALDAFGRRVFELQEFVELICQRCGQVITLSWGEWTRVEDDENGATAYKVAQHKCNNAQPSASVPV